VPFQERAGRFSKKPLKDQIEEGHCSPDDLTGSRGVSEPTLSDANADTL
jgi:hypothetical protein